MEIRALPPLRPHAGDAAAASCRARCELPRNGEEAADSRSLEDEEPAWDSASLSDSKASRPGPACILARWLCAQYDSLPSHSGRPGSKKNQLIVRLHRCMAVRRCETCKAPGSCESIGGVSCRHGAERG